MMRIFLAATVGIIFGLGISISGMINPAKVLNFFDVFGTWDPSLAFVMGGALATTAIGYAIICRFQTEPIYGTKFNIPSNTSLDTRLIGGAALFGIGWGIAGFCPGGAIPALGLGRTEPFIFMGAMVAGIMIARLLNMPLSKKVSV